MKNSSPASFNNISFLAGGGQMGALVREKDWSQSSLGTIDAWPKGLLISLSIVLNSRFPMFLFWGPGHICFYNDAFRPSLGQSGLHPALLGQKAEEKWPGMWGVIKPLIDHVLEGHGATWAEDQLIPVYRNGKMENIYWTFSYSPVRDENGAIAGVLVTSTETTSHVVARQSINETAERLQLATEGSQLGTWDLDLVTDEIVYSARLAEIFGHDDPSKKEAHPVIRGQVHPEDDENIVKPAFKKALETGIYTYEARINRPDDTIRWIRTSGKIVFNETRKPVRMLGTVMDITSQRLAEEDMAKLAAIVESSEDAIVSKRLDGTVVSWNDSAQRVFGYSAYEMIGQSILKLIPPDRVKEEHEIIARLSRGERVEHFETKRLTKDGRLIDLSLTISPIRGRNGQVIGASKIARDVTQQKRTERLVAENEERLKIVIDASELGTWDLDLQKEEIVCSDRYKQIMGFPVNYNPTYNDLLKRLHPADLGIRTQAFEQAYKTGLLHYELRLVLDNGDVRWIENKGKVFFNEQGQPQKLIGTIRDITSDKQAKQQIEESEHRFKVVADTAPVMIWMTDLQKRSVFLNKNWSDFTGIAIAQGLGDGWVTAVHPEDLATTSAAFTKAYHNKTSYTAELRIRRHDGKYRWVKDYAVPRYDADGEFLGFIGTSVDIHEQRDARRELEARVEERTADLLELNDELIRTNNELEQFAYVSSHDLQEPLRKIQTFAEMLAVTLHGSDATATRYVDKIGASAERMSNLIKDLLNYSKLSKNDERFKRTDLGEVLQNIKNDFEVLIMQKNAVIESTPLPAINAIPVQINQLFYNLVSNSLKFSEKEPHIRISATPVSEKEVELVQGLVPGNKYIHLVFEDNGIGFSQVHASQIFVIFQRLNDKQKYSGTGIGLALCKKIIENHHGLISATGEPGLGARFDIYLPV